MEFKILSIRKTREGYHVAVVLSYRDQQEHTLHDRWGAWYIGEPGKRGHMRAPETISYYLAADLQSLKGTKRVVHDKPNLFVAKAKKNPFIEKAKKKPNKFLQGKK